MMLVPFLFLFPLSVSAAMTDEVTELQHEWARIKYQVPAKDQEAAFAQLADRADKVSEKLPGNAEALVWDGIIVSTLAGAKGGLGALGLVKKARTLFEQAIKLDPAAMHGSAYTSLGSLYYQVPSWPVSFGDKDKAQDYLTRGLELNPDGIDSNYFYGDYLLNKGDLKSAEIAFNKALQAPARPGREVADEGRRMEIKQALARIKSRRAEAGTKKALF